MRIIATEKKNKTIQSPWYRPEDAAAYCGLSRSEFDERAKLLPHAGKYRLRIYHQNILDQWLMGDLDVPFDPEEKPLQIVRRVARAPLVGGIMHPRTGKFTPCAGI
jgi:hypothetical protein